MSSFALVFCWCLVVGIAVELRVEFAASRTWGQMLLPYCCLLGVSIKSWESEKILSYPHSSPWALCLCPQAGSVFLFGLFCQGFNLHIWGQSPTTGVILPSSQVLLWEPYCIASENLQIRAGNGCVWSDTWPHTISLAEPWVEGWPLLARANDASSQLPHLKAEVEECEEMDIYTLGIILLCPHTSYLK